MIRKYVKKPLEVEALQWTGDEDEMAEFLGQMFVVVDLDQKLCVETLEGTMKAHLGDYIIRGIKGEYYPCAEQIFLDSYDEVVDAN